MNYQFKNLFFFLVFTCLSQVVFSQTIVTESQYKEMLCSKWLLTSIVIDNKKVELSSEMRNSYMILNKNGELVEIDNNISSKGKWKLDFEKRILITNDKDGIEEHKILKINSTDLVLVSKYEGQSMQMILKKVN